MTEYIKLALKYADLIKSTLGPKGRNKMVKDGENILITNDGATIMRSIKIDNPIGDLFKRLAISQEESVGDGTTTTIVLAGALLENALDLINKGLNPITIIEGYNMAKLKSVDFLNQISQEGKVEDIISTCIGSKVGGEIKEKIIKTVIKTVKSTDLNNLKFYKKDNSRADVKLIKGYGFDGFTRNERMKDSVKGNMCILDFKVNLKTTENYNLKDADELVNLEKKEKEYAKSIIKKLKDNSIDCVFYTDTSREFESYLTDAGITGILLRKKEDIDNISRSLNVKVVPDLNFDSDYVNKGLMNYEKGKVILECENSLIQTLIISGQTIQVLAEIQRTIEDVISILKFGNKIVTGAGAVEIELAKHIKECKVRGKRSVSFEKFSEAIESIPMTIAQNAGLDAWDLLTQLREVHNTHKDIGIDLEKPIKYSNAKSRGIIEPVMIKIYAIMSAVDVVNLILKLDTILVGENEDTKKQDV